MLAAVTIGFRWRSASLAIIATRPPFTLLAAARAVTNRASARGITVSEVEPSGAVFTEHTAHGFEHADHFVDVIGIGLLEANLSLNPIIPQPPIRRARHDAIDGFRRQRPKDFTTIALEDRDRHLLLMRSVSFHGFASKNAWEKPIGVSLRFAARSGDGGSRCILLPSVAGTGTLNGALNRPQRHVRFV